MLKAAGPFENMAERTLIIIKPDGIQRHWAGEIISRFEKKALKLTAAKLVKIPENLARRLYAVHEGKPFFEPIVKYLSSAPVLAMVWEAEDVINITRKLMGTTFGPGAEPGTIRGDFSCSNRYNLIHGADSVESAKKEIELLFKPEEIIDYELTDRQWLYGSDA